MKNTAIYAGTFDIPTNGHIWMINKASKIFDNVIVAIGINPSKKTMFSLEDRLKMLKNITYGMDNVTIDSFTNDYLINYAISKKADFIVRGIRNSNDFEYEKTMRHINEDINSSITTTFLIPPRDISEISSSMVKGLVGPNGWENIVSKYVPTEVFIRFIGNNNSIYKNLSKAGFQMNEYKFWNLYIPQFKREGYHNGTHILSLLKEFEISKHLLSDPLSVEIAIWNHDSIQDLDKGKWERTNEEASAVLAYDLLLDNKMPKEFANKVYDMILKTNHKNIEIEDNDTNYFLDIDLSIFGKEIELFDKYEKGIRFEYNHVSENIFKDKRKQILQGFLDRKYIYRTQFFRDLYEEKARKNLNYSIDKLNKS
jgi:pantetheine-phosphate adenylyltransferase